MIFDIRLDNYVYLFGILYLERAQVGPGSTRRRPLGAGGGRPPAPESRVMHNIIISPSSVQPKKPINMHVEGKYEF